jgi:hypothetical protein
MTLREALENKRDSVIPCRNDFTSSERQGFNLCLNLISPALKAIEHPDIENALNCECGFFEPDENMSTCLQCVLKNAVENIKKACVVK